MAISTVRVKINGSWTNLALNEETGKWEGDITAPSVTSYNLSGGYYPVTVEATNTAGTVETVGDGDATVGNSLKLKVYETVAPTITLSSPANGAYLQSNQPTITFTVVDETSGSGVSADSIALKVDGASVSLTKTSITNGYSCTYIPSGTLSDGTHAIAISASDNDGNAAAAVSASFTVDTIPPTLNVTSPAITITNQASCTVAGTTNDATSSPVTLTVKLNSKTAEAVTVSSDGSFSKTLTLAEGENTITVTSTDAAGRSTTVTKTIELDTTIPEITSVEITPNPANTSGIVTISVTVV